MEKEPPGCASETDDDERDPPSNRYDSDAEKRGEEFPTLILESHSPCSGSLVRQ